ncbi:MAG: MW1434 family type I TA system toxin [Myxococcaceae bacterium]|nr:MW1434 family type I TA system toxin [Myxococcaceae bacterium]
MNIGDAVKALRARACVAREGWNGRGMYLFLHTPSREVVRGSREPSTLPYVVMHTATGDEWPRGAS